MFETVIVIEDDHDLLESIVDFLKFREFNVVGIGHNGLEAVQLYEEHKPNIVLTDISMPNYDGIYGIEHIKKIDPNAKVIVLTGNLDECITKKIKPFNVTNILKKPCSLKIIEQTIKSNFPMTKKMF